MFLIEIIAFTFNADLKKIAHELSRTVRPLSAHERVTILSDEEISEFVRATGKEHTTKVLEPSFKIIIEPLTKLGSNEHCMAYIMDLICTYDESIDTGVSLLDANTFCSDATFPNPWYRTLFRRKTEHSTENAWRTLGAHAKLIQQFPFDANIRWIPQRELAAVNGPLNELHLSYMETGVETRRWKWNGAEPLRKEFLELCLKLQEDESTCRKITKLSSPLVRTGANVPAFDPWNESQGFALSAPLQPKGANRNSLFPPMTPSSNLLRGFGSRHAGDAEFAYVLAAEYRDRVLTLSFREMLLSGYGLDNASQHNKSNVMLQYEQVEYGPGTSPASKR
ncbi:hypothetical protein BU25DRAFT_424421 [Macroventuria anomochaeta]|uniref:Uncharacterized protein n=1 Tax=Macroventuria anomochaeta TaxID=301207 RepID=A0ACB6RSA1_9PLEO|nr:uncharacterized protein BU25DRAFT_424421 [Macroventuria anomochaeta]KAF2624029.1 hypothetical protein BU25DRAFT_424421 [Macroventuria anomochaeta]